NGHHKRAQLHPGRNVLLQSFHLLIASSACNVRSTATLTEYWPACSVARSLILPIRPLSAANCVIKFPNVPVSPSGNTPPVSSGIIMSGPQPTRSLTKHGSPQAIPSLTTSPQVSPPSEGNTSASAAT